MSQQQQDEMAHYIPRRLDDRAKFLFWDWDVAMLGIFGFVMGIISGQMILSNVLGIGGAVLFNKAKAGRHPGFSFHLAYWYLGFPNLRCTPQSIYREFIG